MTPGRCQPVRSHRKCLSSNKGARQQDFRKHKRNARGQRGPVKLPSSSHTRKLSPQSHTTSLSCLDFKAVKDPLVPFLRISLYSTLGPVLRAECGRFACSNSGWMQLHCCVEVESTKLIHKVMVEMVCLFVISLTEPQQE